LPLFVVFIVAVQRRDFGLISGWPNSMFTYKVGAGSLSPTSKSGGLEITPMWLWWQLTVTC